LPFPTVADPEAPPLRTERHIPNSIATFEMTQKYDNLSKGALVPRSRLHHDPPENESEDHD